MTCCICMASRCKKAASLKVYLEFQGTTDISAFYIQHSVLTLDGHCLSKKVVSIYVTLLLFRKLLSWSVKRRGEKCCLLCLLSGAKPRFEEEVLSSIIHQERQENKQGEIHQTEAVARQGEEHWVLIRVWTAEVILFQRDKEGLKRSSSTDRVFSLLHKHCAMMK